MDKSFCPYCMAPVEPGESCPGCGLTAGTYLPSPHHLPPGTILLDRYLVGRVLGEGGFGITYIGRDLRLDLKVAIKEYYPVDRATRNTAASLAVTSFVGPSAQSYERGKQKFLGEARTMARMEKQHVIVSVRDFFEDNNTAYIVMEYVEGITFRDLVEKKGGRIPPGELFETLEPLFHALSIMHESDLIHRDISPDNMMLENGKVRLLDFGCAREASRGTETLTIALKHGYAPLEQYQQKGQGPWTDIYALSATIYFCLTGKAPPQALDRIAEDELLVPSKLGVPLTDAQEAALLKGLRSQPRRRYQTVKELWAALYAPESDEVPISIEPEEPDFPTTEDEPEAAGETGEIPKTGEPEQQRKKLSKGAWIGIGGGALVAVILLIALLPRGGEPQPSPAPAPAAPAAAQPIESAALFEEATMLVDHDEKALRLLMENDRIEAIALTWDTHVHLSEELVVTKPLLVREGASLYGNGPITVDGGHLRIEGEAYTEGVVRTTGGGSIAIGDTGFFQIGGGAMLWCEEEQDFQIEGSGHLELEGQRYLDGGSRSLAFSEAEVFAEATHVTTAEEFYEAIDSGMADAIAVDGDITLNRWIDQRVPVRIGEGVTVSAEPGLGQGGWAIQGTILVNRGSFTGEIAPNGTGNCWDIINYGSITCDMYPNAGGGRGSLLNYGELALRRGYMDHGCFYNFGTFRKTGAGDDGAFFDLTAEVFSNYGEMILERDDAHEHAEHSLAFTGDVRLNNFGTLRIGKGNGIDFRASLNNQGHVTIEEGGQLHNVGIIEISGGGVLEEQAPDGFAGDGFVAYNGLAAEEQQPEPLLLQMELSEYGSRFIPFASGIWDEHMTFVDSPEEVRSALEDENSGVLVCRGDLSLEGLGEVRVENKGLVVTEAISLSGTNLAISGSGGYLLARRVYPGDSAVTVEENAAAIVENYEGGNLRVLTGGRAAARYWSKLNDNMEVDADSRLYLYGGLDMEGVEARIDGHMEHFGSQMNLRGSSIAVGGFFGNFGGVNVDENVHIENDGFLTLSHFGWNGHEVHGSLLNRGHIDWGSGIPLYGNLVNEGMLNVYNWDRALEVRGRLQNSGEIWLHDGANIVAMSGGVVSGNEPRPWSE